MDKYLELLEKVEKIIENDLSEGDSFNFPSNKQNEGDLNKMSQPMMKLPPQKNISSRPDQEVYPVNASSGKRKVNELGYPEKSYPEKRLQTALKEDRYQRVEDPHTVPRGQRLTSEMRSNRAGGVKGVFIPGTKTHRAFGSTRDPGVKEHEGQHLLSQQIVDKYGIDQAHRFYDSIIDNIHPKTQKKIKNMLTSNPNYARMEGHTKPRYQLAFKEEMVNLLRDVLVNPTRREQWRTMHNVDKKGQSLLENPFHTENFKTHDKRAKQSWKNLVNHAKNYDFKPSKVTKKSESVDTGYPNLKKGSFQRKNKFNPRSERNLDVKVKQRGWSSEEKEEAKYNLPEMERGAKMRGLRKLATQTHVMKHPKTGEMHFLMHRGASNDEVDKFSDGVKIHYPSQHRNSWTPLHDIASEFGATKNSSVLSAWVPESSLVHCFNQYNSPNLGAMKRHGLPPNRLDTESEEQEWLVEHSQPLHHANLDALGEKDDVHSKINRRQEREDIKQNFKKLAASEMVYNDLNKSKWYKRGSYITGNDINKGLKGLKEGVTAGATLLTLIGGAHQMGTKAPVDRSPSSIYTSKERDQRHEVKEGPDLDLKYNMLTAFAKHQPQEGKYLKNRQRHGRYNLPTKTIKDTVQGNSSLLQRYGDVLSLDEHNLSKELQNKPHLDRAVASTHWGNLQEQFGNRPDHIAHAWHHGANTTKNLISKKTGDADLSHHFYVNKILNDIK